MKLTKKLLALALCLILCLSLSVTAFATSGSGSVTVYDQLDKVGFSKTLIVATGIDISAVDEFTLTFTAQDTDTSTAVTTPAISTQTLEVGEIKDGKAVASKTIASILPAVADYKHAGIFAYMVEETDISFETYDDTNKITKTLTCNPDKESYLLRVYVLNDGDGLKFGGVTVERWVNGVTTDVKVNPTLEKISETDERKISGFNFTNEYSEVLGTVPPDPTYHAYTVTKEIDDASEYGDKTLEFAVAIEITLPELYKDGDIALASDSEGTLAVAADGKSATVTGAMLKHGEFIAFSKFPAGSVIKVTETQDSRYSGKINGDFFAAMDYATKGADVVATSSPITAKGAAVVMNSIEAPTPTGIEVNNLPFALIAALALTGILVFFVANRRKVED